MEENKPIFKDVQLAADNGVPVIGFAAGPAAPTAEHFDIGGISFDAYYDAAHKLLFVLDTTRDEFIPNDLLILDAAGDRKWDDILANDFGADLNAVRPRANNKFLPLDIEYAGLSIYNDAVMSGDSAALREFRIDAGLRLTRERLADANAQVATATATRIESDSAIKKLRAEKKALSAKLKSARSDVGKTPNAAAAAKILRIQSKIEQADVREKRALGRHRRAEKRLRKYAKLATLLTERLDKFPKQNYAEAIKMAENQDVQPLVGNDPKIMNDAVAFRPLEFSAVPTTPQPAAPAPVFDAPMSPDPIVARDMEALPTAPAPTMAAPIVPPVMNTAVPVAPAFAEAPSGEPAALSTPVPPVAPNPPAPPRVAPEMAGNSFSGYTGGGNNGTAVATNTGRHRPNPTYYLLLAVLIALSILTLWLYQQRMGGAVPEFAAAQNAPVVTEQTAEPAPMITEPTPIVSENPFFDDMAAPEPAPVLPEIPAEQPMPEPIYDAPASIDNYAVPVENYSADYDNNYYDQPPAVPQEPIAPVEYDNYAAEPDYDYSAQPQQANEFVPQYEAPAPEPQYEPQPQYDNYVPETMDAEPTYDYNQYQ